MRLGLPVALIVSGCGGGERPQPPPAKLSCPDGRADCDGQAANGCEASLAEPGSCGACGVTCEGDEDCGAGACRRRHGDVASGGRHACVAFASGRVQCWGSNEDGELGRGTTSWGEPRPAWVPGITDARQIAAGGGSSCVVRGAGRSVSCWGAITGSATPTSIPGLSGVRSVTVHGRDACVVGEGGAVSCWGADALGRSVFGKGRTVEPQHIASLPPATAVRMGPRMTCALLESDDVSCWGLVGASGSSPRVALGVDQVVQMAVSSRLVARRRDGSVVAWGPVRGKEPTVAPLPEIDLGGMIDGDDTRPCQLDAQGRVGCSDGPGGRPLSIQPRLALEQAVQLSAQGSLRCALLVRGGRETVSCWGDNEQGGLGVGTMGVHAKPVQVHRGAREIRVGFGGACALDAAGAVSCWGGGEAAKAPVEGLGGGVERLLAGIQFGGLCAQQKGKDLACWLLTHPRKATPVVGIGDVVDQALYSGAAGNWVYSITKGALFAWRHDLRTGNVERQAVPGLKGLTQVRTDHRYVCVLDKKGNGHCASVVDPFAKGAKHRWVPFEPTLVGLSLGTAVCALDAAGLVGCFDDDLLPSGLIPLAPQPAFSSATLLATGNHLVALGKDGHLRSALGLDQRGSGRASAYDVRLDLGVWRDVAGVSTDSYVTCLSTGAGDVWCAGSNADRTLGLEDPPWVAAPQPVALASD